jgi:hypothetical protein
MFGNMMTASSGECIHVMMEQEIALGILFN